MAVSPHLPRSSVPKNGAPNPCLDLVNKAAQDILGPLGLKPKGNQGTWLDDQRWWLVVVEFRPEAWSKGIYVNLGWMWLFFPQASVATHGGRQHFMFIPYANEEQFRRPATDMCQAVAAKVKDIRQQFDGLHAARDHLIAHIDPQNALSLYHAAIVCGLTNAPRDADRLFGMIESGPWKRDWENLLKKRAQECRAKAADAAAFKNCVVTLVNNSRTALKLERVPNPLQA